MIKVIQWRKGFFRTGELNGSSYAKILLRSNTTLNIQKKHCFLWYILPDLYPCENSHPARVSIYSQYVEEINIQGLDFSNGFKCSDVHKYEKLKKICRNIFEKIYIKMETVGNIIQILLRLVKMDQIKLVT